MSLYVMITLGDQVWASTDKEDVMNECKMHVHQYIGDFLDHQLPLRVTDEIRKQFDLRLIQVNNYEPDSKDACCELALPLQKWADEYYEEVKKDLEREESAHADPEWSEYQRLRKKFAGIY